MRRRPPPSPGSAPPTADLRRAQEAADALRPFGVTMQPGVKDPAPDRTLGQLLPLLGTYGPRAGDDPLAQHTLLAILYSLAQVVADGRPDLLGEEAAARLVELLRPLIFFGTIPVPAAPLLGWRAPAGDTEVRLAALQLLSSAARCSHKAFVGQWLSLLPDQPSSDSNPTAPTLFTALRFDPVPRVRSAACFALTVLLEDARPYLQQANDRTPLAASFVPYAVRLGAMLLETHLQLFTAVSNEVAPNVLTMCFKTLATLITNTPYGRLSLGPRLLDFLAGAPYTAASSHWDPAVRTAALSVLTATLSTPKGFPGIGDFLCGSGAALLALVEGALLDPHPPVRAEALRIHGALAACHRPHIQQRWDGLLNTLTAMIVDREPSVRQGVIQLVHNYTEGTGGSEDAALSSGLDPDEAQSSGAADVSRAEWDALLTRLLAPARHDPVPATRAAAFSCFAHMPAPVIAELQDNELGGMLAWLFLAAGQDVPPVRVAVCRVLGAWVYHPTVTQNTAIIRDIAVCLERLLAASSPTPVRVRASWAVANLCDALRQSRCRGLTNPDSLILDLLSLATAAVPNSHKVKCNLVRAVGNLSNVASGACLLGPVANTRGHQTEASAAPSFGGWSRRDSAHTPTPTSILQIIIDRQLDAFEDANVKVRWNGCCSVGHLLANPALPPLAPTVLPLITAGIAALAAALQRDHNFKVRIQAGNALLGAGRWALSDATVPLVWAAVLDAIDNAHVVADFDQYKFSQLLRDQLHANLRQLIRECVPLTEFPSLLPVLQPRATTLLLALDAIEGASSPDTSGDLDAALADLAVATAEAVVSDADHPRTSPPRPPPAVTVPMDGEFAEIRTLLRTLVSTVSSD